MHGKQCSDERLYLRKELGGRGIKSLKDVHAETKVGVACCMTFSNSMWIKEAWKRVVTLAGKSVKRSRRSNKGNKCQCIIQRRWIMATIRRQQYWKDNS